MKTEPFKAVPGSPVLGNQQEKLSYALGMVLGNQFRDQGVELDLVRYNQGLGDALAGDKTLLTESEARAAVSALQTQLQLRKKASPPAAATRIEVSFKLDPRLTRSMYMGDRWVSLPTFTSAAREGEEMTIQARAQGVGAGGRTLKISPEWIPDDPGMVTVTPAQGEQVTITVKGAGQSRLKVVGPEVATELKIHSTSRDGILQVEISQ